MNKEIKNKLQRGLALTVKESQDLYKYIKALEQQPCEDAISRQAVIELVKNSYYDLCSSMEDTWAMVEDVERLPSVNPQESILDKIKAEIDAQIDMYDTPIEIDGGLDESYRKGLYMAKKIINKYKGESK